MHLTVRGRSSGPHHTRPSQDLFMRVMKAAETRIPVITTIHYDNPWECLEEYRNIVPHKKFNAKLFPDGIPARSGGMAIRYKLLHDLSLLTMADIVLGDGDRYPEEILRGLVANNKVFSLKQVLCLLSRGFSIKGDAKIRESYCTNNYFFVEAEEDSPCVVIASPDTDRQGFSLRTVANWRGGMPYGNYGNLFIPAPLA